MDKYTYKKEAKDSEVVLTITVSPESFMEAKNKVYNKLSQDVVIQGFRPGKAPKALIEAHISEKVYNQTINNLVPDVTSEIFTKENINPLTQVSYEIVKMSDADGIEYKAKFIEYPVITLGDFSKIKVEKKEKLVTDEEVDKQLLNLIDYYQKNKAGQQANLKTDEKAPKDAVEKKQIEVTDELIKSLNIGFDNVSAIKEQVKKEINNLNQKDSEGKWIEEVVNEAVKLSNIEAPKALVIDSIQAKEKEYMKKLEELNLKLDEFLKVQNTTIEKLRADWENESKKRLANELLLLEIIKQNKITVTEEDINKEIEKVVDPQTKANLEKEEGRKYLVTLMLQEKAIGWLKQSVEKK